MLLDSYLKQDAPEAIISAQLLVKISYVAHLKYFHSKKVGFLFL